LGLTIAKQHDLNAVNPESSLGNAVIRIFFHKSNSSQITSCASKVGIVKSFIKGTIAENLEWAHNATE
jgi:hypothetical protein